MPLTIEPLAATDFPRAFEVQSLSFGLVHPLINALFPKHETPDGRIAGAKRLAEAAQDASVRSIKVTNEDEDGKIVAYAKWLVYENTVPDITDLDGPYWDDGKGDKAYAREMCRVYLQRRNAAIRKANGNIVVLDILVVDPTEQRRGAGRMLTKWGVDEADRLGFPAVVEATPEGAALYEQYGFKTVEKVVMHMPEPWASEPVQTFWWMERPAKV